MVRKISDARQQLHLCLDRPAGGRLRGLLSRGLGGRQEGARGSHSNPGWSTGQPRVLTQQGCHFYDSTKQLSAPSGLSIIAMCSAIFSFWKKWFSELSADPLLTTAPGRRGEFPRKGLLGGLSRQGATSDLPTIHQL